MDKVQVLTDMKIILGVDSQDTSKDALLNILINDAENDIQTFCKNDFMDGLAEDGVTAVYAFPDLLVGSVRDLAMVAYRKRGAEGKNSESVGGLSTNFDTDIPKNIKNKLYPFRLLNIK